MAVQDAMERPLGPQEALFGEMNRRANGAVQLTCMAEFDPPVDAESVRRALRLVHARHPMLRARMEDRDRLWWVCDVPFERIHIGTQALGSVEIWKRSMLRKPGRLWMYRPCPGGSCC